VSTIRSAAAALIGAALLTSLTPGDSGATGGCPAPTVVAHRGESSLAPEETGPAIAAAVRSGSQIVEMDIRFTKSNVPVLLHDATVDRTTNGTGYVSSMWLWQVNALDSGTWFSTGYTGTKVATLITGLRLIRVKAGVLAIPELKTSPTSTQLGIIVKVIADAGMNGRVIVQSFSATDLNRFHAIAPTVPLALTTSAEPADPVAAVKAAHATYWLPAASNLTAEHLAAAQSAGIKVWPWTADTTVEWERLSTMGVDGVLTNRAAQYVGWAKAQCGG
jgi:glycerophosphoryl diester phosphodiesterase